ncbi:TetR/AcrR family transcriptional regulator [Iodidimonas sp. SYSU 1G8]|uniref:TetR/AcrR family transcriptional regulator n=1 Tax=Iodidimonas sp. SYSU 1G8 TaxID=3133967 RepID=UPI0031FF2E39
MNRKTSYGAAFVSQSDGNAAKARQKRMAALEKAKGTTDPDKWQTTKSGFTRESILRAVVECLAEDGYSRLTMTQVAKKAGLTKGALQHYFDSKSAAIEAALTRIFEDQLALQRESARRPTEAADDQLHDRRIEALWHYVRDSSYVAFMEIAMAGRKEPHLHKLVQAHYQEYFRLSREAAAELLPEWQADVEKFNFVAHLVSTVIEGMAVRQEFGISDEHYDEAVRAFLKRTVGDIFTGKLSPFAPGAA